VGLPRRTGFEGLRTRAAPLGEAALGSARSAQVTLGRL